MNKIGKVIMGGILSLAAVVAVAQGFTRLELADPSEAEGITFISKVSVGGGDHNGTIQAISGQLNLDSVTHQFLNGGFAVSIYDLRTGNDQRDCHMREALGLDYTISQFPEKHVCEKARIDDEVVYQVPDTGPDSIVYPEILFEILEIKNSTGDSYVFGENSSDVALDVKWTIHGVEQFSTLESQIEKVSDNQYRFIGKTKLSLNDFGIVVKKFLSIGVKDEVPVSVNVVLTSTAE